MPDGDTNNIVGINNNRACRPAGRKLSRENLLELQEASDWNKAEVARQIGLSRTAVWKYMKKWEIPLQKQA
ncbi:MAG: winged helix-turn-helix transcriptional regulator [Deltaproteobacteria bacterium]|nr:winged helix-turn-helix transcriptional regulator [Deltaproteobacteria bacterium]MBW2705351.1 winged helix-turn-helix transcriptional regulator [Deltaproteobacteria bacterium]